MFYSAEVDILLNFILVINLEDDQLVKKMAITFATTAPAREVVSRILHVKLTMHRDKLGIFFSHTATRSCYVSFATVVLTRHATRL